MLTAVEVVVPAVVSAPLSPWGAALYLLGLLVVLGILLVAIRRRSRGPR